jgi:hypothetical protein
MPLRHKYSVTDWVLAQDNVKPGDWVAFYCDRGQQEIQAQVLELPSLDRRQFLTCKIFPEGRIEDINFYSTVVYKIKRDQIPILCTCGARFTSNPQHHLAYCDITIKNS